MSRVTSLYSSIVISIGKFSSLAFFVHWLMFNEMKRSTFSFVYEYAWGGIHSLLKVDKFIGYFQSVIEQVKCCLR